MSEFRDALRTALALLLRLDGDLTAIVGLSLLVSLSAVFLAALAGLPAGAAVALCRFPGRQAVRVLLNALLGIPPVVIGLVVYLFLSRAGPLGGLGLLFTPSAMIIAQWLLVTPIIAALTQQTVSDLHEEYAEQLRSLGVGTGRAIPTLLWEGRLSLVVAVMAGFGRAIAEVGAVIIVGGNINHVTRVMTTAIALETSKGEFEFALALGVLLLATAFLVNFIVQYFQSMD